MHHTPGVLLGWDCGGAGGHSLDFEWPAQMSEGANLRRVVAFFVYFCGNIRLVLKWETEIAAAPPSPALARPLALPSTGTQRASDSLSRMTVARIFSAIKYSSITDGKCILTLYSDVMPNRE